MGLGLNWVDWVIIGTIVFFAFGAIRRSLLSELLDLLSFLLAAFLSFSYYNFPAKLFVSWFQISYGLSLVLGFIVIWFLSETIFFILVWRVLPKHPKVKILQLKIVSVIPAILRAIVFIALALVMTATFPIQPSLKKAVLDSKVGSQILKYAYNLESPLKSVFGGVANDTLTFLTIEPKTNETVKIGFRTTQISIDEVSENIMTSLINKERVSRGIKALEFDSRLRDIARAHSADMFSRGYFAHYSPENKTVADRALLKGADFLVIGENLAYAPSVELAHKGLMNSKGHRENILSSDFGRIGIGIMDGGVYGKMFTQVFTN